MQREDEKLLATKEADRKQEIEQLKIANNIAMSEKDEEMKRMLQELEDYKSKQEKMSNELINDYNNSDVIINQQEN